MSSLKTLVYIASVLNRFVCMTIENSFWCILKFLGLGIASGPFFITVRYFVNYHALHSEGVIYFGQNSGTFFEMAIPEFCFS